MGRTFMFVAAIVFASMANAHTAGQSFLSIRSLGTSEFSLELDLDLVDLQQLLQLDGNADGALTWREIESATPVIEREALLRTRFTAGNALCVPSSRAPLAIAEHGGGPFARLSFVLDCQGATLAVDYSDWFLFDPGHRALLDFEDADLRRSATLLSQHSPRWQMREPTFERLRRFLFEGTFHLFTGYDHVAFLVVLLLALMRRPKASVAPTPRAVMRRALTVITAFTVAHSITLGLAATGSLVLPSKPVEIAIAASVMVAALLNWWRDAGAHGWKLAFVFGLVHGLGFAGALADMSDGPIDLMALASFNIGIELAQLAVAAFAVPTMWTIFRHANGERIGVPATSTVVAVMAAFWMTSRIGDVVG